MARDIIVIGGSAGSIDALSELLHAVPADLGAQIFVVIHIPHDHDSLLPKILGRAGALKVIVAEDGELFEQNHVYVAPPGRHLQLENDRMRLVFGPFENRSRPSIDPLFRTAAMTFGRRVIGIILSGTLDDGSNGLALVKRFGGIAIVQDPDDAEFPEMPRSALMTTEADHCVPAREIGAFLHTLVKEPVSAEDKSMVQQEPDQQFVGITCPDCHGPIYISRADAFLYFRCVSGHSYSPETMRMEHRQGLENALWSAVASLREHANLLRKMAENLPARAKLLVNDAQLKEEHARELEALVERLSS